MISLLERGHFDRVSMRLVRRVLATLDATLALDVRWRGAALDRLVDESHAALVAVIAERLRELGWVTEIEVTYSEFGERGSFDIIAAYSPEAVVLVIEVKSDLASAEATLRKLDEKTRLGPKIARDRFGWRPRAVGRLLVVPESSTVRRRIARHSALFDHALPARNVEVRRWLQRPSGGLSGVWFLSPRDGRVVNSAARSRERVRRPRSVPGNRLIDA